jgi:hypothetical protein
MLCKISTTERLCINGFEGIPWGSRSHGGDLYDDVVVDLQKPERTPIQSKSLFTEMPFDARAFEISWTLKNNNRMDLTNKLLGIVHREVIF